MTETYDGYRKAQLRRAATAANTPENVRMLRLAAQASASAELLTGDKNWDVFLRYMANALKTIDKRIEDVKAMIEHPRCVDQNALMHLKIQLADFKGQRLALDWVMELPKAIKETGHAAKAYMDKLPE